MNGLRLRREPRADDSLVLLRGGLLDEETLRRDARMTMARFGEYGVSVLAAPDEAAFDRLAAGPLRAYAQLTLMTAGAVRGTGVELRPTFRQPHYTVVFADLDRDVARLAACENAVRTNPHHQTTPGEERR